MKRDAKALSRLEAGAPAVTPDTKRAGGLYAGRSMPPYHPALERLVNDKQAWAVPLDESAKAKGFRGWHQRGYLPHYDAPGVTQFVTLRLADSLPASRRGEWEQLLRIEDQQALMRGRLPAGSEPTSRQPADGSMPPSAAGRERRKRLESYLDRGLGACWLRQPAVAALVEGALRFFDGQRYTLGAWVVMPNHLHLLVEIRETPLADLVKSWKVHVAREANHALGRNGTFWEREYLDTVIVDERHRRTAVRYIENNPVKAKLALDPKDWRWSSARWRDEYGRLPPALGAGAPTSSSA